MRVPHWPTTARPNSKSNVNNVNAYIMLLHLLLDVVDAITQGFKIAHVKYL